MRSLAAAATAGLATLFALTASHAPPAGRRGPSGRAGPARADGGSGDGGTADAGSLRRTREARPRVLGDPPGTMRLANTPEPADGGLPDVSARVGKLEQEIGELRGRAAALEAQLQQAQAQTRLLQQLNEQMADLRRQIAAEAQRKAQAEEQQAARRAEMESALTGLRSAEQVLAGGSADVGSALDEAERTLSGQARRDVGSARRALQNHDLAQARYFLRSAISHAWEGQ